jgi:hypothetical protein
MRPTITASTPSNRKNTILAQMFPPVAMSLWTWIVSSEDKVPLPTSSLPGKSSVTMKLALKQAQLYTQQSSSSSHSFQSTSSRNRGASQKVKRLFKKVHLL